MAWIESHDELPTHPKTRKAARLLGVNAPTMIGHLHVLWYWCLTHRPDGLLLDMDAEDVADAAEWEGDPGTFTSALVKAGWLDDGPSCYAVHDWWDGAGKTIKRRKYATKRQRRARDTGPSDDQSQSSHADVTRDTNVSHGADSDRDSDRDKTQTTTSDVPSDPDVTDDARNLTREFARGVKANGHPVPQPDRPAHTSWLVEMDRLLRIGPPGWDGDPPPVDEVRRVIEWCASDDFERANVRSVPKLRERYSQLRLKATNTGTSRKRGVAEPPPRDADYLEGWTGKVVGQ